MKIGIFGGSFNPPHKMHEMIAKQLIKEQLVDTIIFVPTGMKYEYKNNLIDDQYRCDMLRIIAKQQDAFQVSDFECKEEVVYTYQTLDHFQEMYPSAEIYFICGTDNFSYVSQWRRGDYLLEKYKFIVISRSTNEVEPLLAKYKDYKDNIIVSKMPPEDMSSSYIRRKIHDGNIEEVREQLDEQVLDYIIKNQLYKENI